MTLEERVHGALRSAQPAPALHALIGELAHEGLAKGEIIELLEKLVVQQRTCAESREQDEEAMLDALDALHGWCHPAAELLPEKPRR